MAAPHLLADPAATPSADPAGAWLPLSAALTAQIPAIAGRDDLVVACAPGAGHGAPGCYLPALARVEVDGTHLGARPCHRRPRPPQRPGTLPRHLGRADPRGRPRRATAAGPPRSRPPRRPPGPRQRSCWRSPGSKPPSFAAAPGDRRWLRASARPSSS